MKAIEYSDDSRKWHRPGTERLTRYELECGAVMSIESEGCTIDSGIRLELWKEPGCSVYQVRAHDFGKHERIFWDSFDTYTAASKRYFRARKELNV